MIEREREREREREGEILNFLKGRGETFEYNFFLEEKL